MKERYDDFGSPLESGIERVYITQEERRPQIKYTTIRLRALEQEDFERIYVKIKDEKYDDFGAAI